jgi:hypothetical protein
MKAAELAARSVKGIEGAEQIEGTAQVRRTARLASLPVRVTQCKTDIGPQIES